MNNRCSVRFVNGRDRSIVFYSRTAGGLLREAALEFLSRLPPMSPASPVSRREVDALMAAFTSRRILVPDRLMMQHDQATDAGAWDINVVTLEAVNVEECAPGGQVV